MSLAIKEVVTKSFHSFEYYPADSVVALPQESPKESFRELNINTNKSKLLENELVSLVLDIKTD